MSKDNSDAAAPLPVGPLARRSEFTEAQITAAARSIGQTTGNPNYHMRAKLALEDAFRGEHSIPNPAADFKVSISQETLDEIQRMDDQLKRSAFLYGNDPRLAVGGFVDAGGPTGSRAAASVPILPIPGSRDDG